MLAVLAEFERDQISERTCTAMDQLRRRKRRHTRFAPFGYSWGDGEVVAVSEEHAHIRTMASLRDAGWSYQRIADELDRIGVPTRTGVPWNWASVRSILTNRMRDAERSTPIAATG